MNDQDNRQQDLETLRELNTNYIRADQFNDVAWYNEILADDYVALLPDLVRRDKAQFLDLISKPRPFKNLTPHDVDVRLFGDFAPIHGRVTYTTLDGVEREALYTDIYQRRDGKWKCVAAAVVAKGD